MKMSEDSAPLTQKTKTHSVQLADIHDRVMEAYYGKLGDQFMRETQDRIHWICSQVTGTQVLDVGCSQGIVPLLLAREGCNVIGVDTSPKAIQEATHYLKAEPEHVQQKVSYVNADFLSLQTDDIDAETIVLSEVLEHLVRPELFIIKAASLLDEGGRLVVTVPFGVNDYIDHKHTFYLHAPYMMLAKHLEVIEVKMLGKWIGLVAVKRQVQKISPLDFMPADKVVDLEVAFESVERSLLTKLDQSAKRLVDANNKYRASTEQLATIRKELTNAHTEQLATIKKELTIAHTEQLTTVKNELTIAQDEANGLRKKDIAHIQRVSELSSQLKAAIAKSQAAEQRLIKTRASLTYQLGYSLRVGFSSIGGFIRLPKALATVLRKALVHRRKQREKHSGRRDNVKSPAEPLLRRIPRNDIALPEELDNAASVRQYLLPDVHQPRTMTKVACVMDEFTYGAFRHECELKQLTPVGWQAEIEKFVPELLIIESAWRGKDDLWGNKVGHNSQELQNIVEWCRQKNIPTVFWNKEDPVHFETFLTTAKQFDFVFTTDIDCIHRYKAGLGHHRVYLLPFACQPVTHNPIELYVRKNAFCFAGAYYARYPERTRDLDDFVETLPGFRPLEIFDRNFGKHDTNYQFPEKYHPYIAGTLAFSEIDKAYKGYRFAVNLNSIKQSQSMFARRVFELLGSNTVTLSNYSLGVRLLFGDLVISSDSGEEVVRRMQALHSDDERSDKIRLAALRKVMQQHTYAHRFAYIVSKVTGQSAGVALPEMAVFSYATGKHEYEVAVANMQRQRYAHAKMYLIVEDSNAILDELKDPRITVLSEEECATLTLSQLAGGAQWFASFSVEDYYGPNYLLDIALATKYSKAAIIGKSTYYSLNGRDVDLIDKGCAYRLVDEVPSRRAVCAREVIEAELSVNWLRSLAQHVLRLPNILSIDPFNYCLGGSTADTAALPRVDDIEVDPGLDVDDLLARAESIEPAEVAIDECAVLDGRRLSEVFGPLKAKRVEMKLQEHALRFCSSLDDGQHEYFYAANCLRLEELAGGSELKLFLDVDPGLNIQLVVQFLDANEQRVSHTMIQANRNQTTEIPVETRFVRLGWRVYAHGEATVNGLLLGHRKLERPQPITQAQHLLITNNYPSYENIYRNGFVHSRVLAYRKSGLEIDVFRLRDNEPKSYQEFENVDVITGCRAALRELLESGRYKTVLIHFLSPAMWGVISGYLENIKVIVWVHGAEIQPWWRRKFNFKTDAELQIGKFASSDRLAFWRDILNPMPPNMKLVFVSRFFAEQVMEDIGFRLSEENYEVIHNPIDTNLFCYEEKKPEQRKKILSIRPFASPVYANDLTVKTILSLSTKPWFNELEFRIVGDGVLFEETVEPLGNFANVIVERRFLRREEIAELHKRYGIFLCPSRMDTQGVSRDEAMASGLVPVTNAAGAIPEFVNSECGIVVPEEDVQGLAQAISSLVEDGRLFTELSSQASKAVLKNRSVDQIVEAELSLLGAR